MKRYIRFGLILVIGMLGGAGTLRLSAWSRQQARPNNAAPPPAVASTAGQTATLLPNGTWLVVGGEEQGIPRTIAALSNAQTGDVLPLSAGLEHARAWHSATLLPDGSVLILGGIGVDGHIVPDGEIYDPHTATFHDAGGSIARAHHTATVLTDGRVLIAGGISELGEPLTQLELWNPTTKAAELMSAQLSIGRYDQSATFLPDGSVLLWGGFDEGGNALQDGEVVDANAQRAILVNAPLGAADASAPPALEASIPGDGALDVATDAGIVLRFSKGLQAASVNSDSIALISDTGAEPVRVIPVNDGMLAFMTPVHGLRAATQYIVSLRGLSDDAGRALADTSLTFRTAGRSNESQSNAAGVRRSDERDLSGGSQTNDDEDVSSEAGTAAGAAAAGGTPGGQADSVWRSLPPLQATSGVTALAGQVLQLDGKPLPGVTLGIGDRNTRTDQTGRFLLVDIPAGTLELLIDGRTANTRRRTYGVFEVAVVIKAGETNVLPFTSWMPRIDTAHAVTIASPTQSEVVVRNPRAPGLEVRIPANSIIRDHEGRAVTEVSITPIPLDRPPFPLAANVVPPVYFTFQPGGGYIENWWGSGARVIYPNTQHKYPGDRAKFWHYHPDELGWTVYGLGTVSADGSQIVPDPGIGIYEFTGAMLNSGGIPPDNAPVPGNHDCDGDPCVLSSGVYLTEHTDLYLADVIPIAFTRTYQSGDAINTREFGLGWRYPYDMFLWSAQQWQEADLVLTNGGKIHYTRTSPGGGFADAVFEHHGTPTIFNPSRLAWNGGGWDLTLKDGTVYVFGENAPLQSIRDRFGNQLLVSHANGQSGNVTRVTSPNGRWVSLMYDATNTFVTAISDSLGRTVTYTYDQNHLQTVTDANGGVTTYTYATLDGSPSDSNQTVLTSVRNPRDIVSPTNEYYFRPANCGQGAGCAPRAGPWISRQTLADNSVYQFEYASDSSFPFEKIELVVVTDPRGNRRFISFNGNGYTTEDTRARTLPEEQTIEYERQSGSNVLLSVTDALNRKTTFAYDSLNNVSAVTQMADTAEAVTTSFTYEPTFSQLTSIVDPLGHTTTLTYDARGALQSVLDAVGHTWAVTTNTAGQLTSIADPLGHQMQLAYSGGNLSDIIDATNGRTRVFSDGAGRTLSMTDPLGRITRYSYDVLDRLTRVVDPLGGITNLSYDANGNLLSVTDALAHATTYTYDPVDRLSTRRDPLSQVESYQYDPSGNLSSFTDRKGQVAAFAYDGLNRRTFSGFRKQVNGGNTTYESTKTVTYDLGDRLTQVVDSVGGTISRSYDGLSRVLSETTGQGVVNYTYDAAGRRQTMTVGGQPSVVYTWDDANRLIQLVQGSSTVSIPRDIVGRRQSVTLPNGIDETYTYDAASRVTSITYKHGATTLGDLNYLNDAAGRRIQVTGSYARTGLPQAITSASYDAANRLTNWNGTALAYDANGNLIGDGVNSYAWNGRNQLFAISHPQFLEVFIYDAFGRRSQKTVANGPTTRFLYDRLNAVQELSTTAVTANLLTGLRIDEYFARVDANGASWFLSDALGSTIALADDMGAVQTQYMYDPFGDTSSSGGANASSYQFTARENDNTGLYYYRARYYMPRIQRFISPDPLRISYHRRSSGIRRLAGALDFAEQVASVGSYSYASNRPTTRVDPLGLFPISSDGGDGQSFANADEPPMSTPNTNEPPMSTDDGGLGPDGGNPSDPGDGGPRCPDDDGGNAPGDGPYGRAPDDYHGPDYGFGKWNPLIADIDTFLGFFMRDGFPQTGPGGPPKPGDI